MCELGGLVQEQVLYDDAFHVRQGFLDMLCIRVRLGNVLALDVHALVLSGTGGIQHVGDAKTGLGVQFHIPVRFEARTNVVVLDRPVTGEFVREGAHVAGALHVILATKRVYAAARVADIAGGHREIGHANDHRRALAVFRHAEAVVDGATTGRAVEAGRRANLVGRHTGDFRNRFGRVLRLQDHRLPGLEGLDVTTLFHVLLVDKVFRNDNVCECIDNRHVRAGQQCQVMRGPDMW